MYTFDIFDRKMETTECEHQGKTAKEEHPRKHQCLLIMLRLLLVLNIEIVPFFRNQSIIIVVINNCHNYFKITEFFEKRKRLI